LSLSQRRKQIEYHFYINIHELINIQISADSHPITFVYASGGSRPIRRDWLIHLIGIASKHFFSSCHIVKITRRKIICLNLSNTRYFSGSKKTHCTYLCLGKNIKLIFYVIHTSDDVSKN